MYDSWEIRANCKGVDPELFFPERGGSVKEAKAVCMDCEVREECLEAAFARSEKIGIWGGLTEHERRKLRSERARAKRQA